MSKFSVIHRKARISPQKMMIFVLNFKLMLLSHAFSYLNSMFFKKASKILYKTLLTALNNLLQEKKMYEKGLIVLKKENKGVSEVILDRKKFLMSEAKNYFISEIFVNNSVTFKKPYFRAKGRYNVLTKSFCNIFITLTFFEVEKYLIKRGSYIYKKKETISLIKIKKPLFKKKGVLNV